MARDTRGPVPVGESDLRRFSLNPLHWRQARWMLCIEAVLVSLLGVAGLVGVYGATPRGTGVSVLGLDMTPVLSWTMLATGVAAAVSMLHRRFAMVFSAVVAVAALVMVIVSAVAAAHHDPGPLGFTAADTLLYGVLFCYNLAVGMWLVPNHIEGPTWMHVRRSRARKGSDAPTGTGS